MAISVSFTPSSMSAAQYDECIERLETAGAAAPPGRSYHACYGSGDQLRIFDVWDSEEAFMKFTETISPILEQIGMDLGNPEIKEVHKVVKGS